MDFADDVAYSVHDVEDSVVHNDVALSVLRDEGQARAVAEHVYDWYGRGEVPELLDALERLREQPWWMDEYDGSHRALAGLKDMTSQLIGRLCDSVVDETRARYGDGPLTRHAADLVISPQVQAEMLVLKGIAVHFLMAPRERTAAYRQQRERLSALVLALEARGAEAMELHFAALYEEAADDAARKRVAVDQVASLTDKSAHDWYHRFVVARR